MNYLNAAWLGLLSLDQEKDTATIFYAPNRIFEEETIGREREKDENDCRMFTWYLSFKIKICIKVLGVLLGIVNLILKVLKNFIKCIKYYDLQLTFNSTSGIYLYLEDKIQTHIFIFNDPSRQKRTHDVAKTTKLRSLFLAEEKKKKKN
ncbi:hypothetical protein PUN28_006016 [Cardiocondyla obscurior]|uniref:Uncharacterized protein n=1 Tax=Cardiocondyla obscurior TaxID=286306 RepID=A0AAW2G793_9HYME